MFGKKVAVKEKMKELEVKVEEVEKVIPGTYYTQELLAANKINILDRMKEFEHYERMYSLRDTLNIHLSPRLIERLHAANIRWIVPSSFIREFEYHASVRGECISYYDGKGSAEYLGDLPEFVLDNMKVATDLGVEFMTIHSNYPLPRKVANCDPILLGWAINPSIKLWSNSGTLYSHRYGTEAIVLAVWDFDKELEIK